MANNVTSPRQRCRKRCRAGYRLRIFSGTEMADAVSQWRRHQDRERKAARKMFSWHPSDWPALPGDLLSNGRRPGPEFVWLQMTIPGDTCRDMRHWHSGTLHTQNRVTGHTTPMISIRRTTDHRSSSPISSDSSQRYHLVNIIKSIKKSSTINYVSVLLC